jgi:carbon monoxide dehydrogenase subunit G
MPQYVSQEITVQAPRQAVIAFFSDPFAVAGASGHFAILQVWDETANKWVSPSVVKGVARKFRAAFVAQLPKGDEVKGILGTFEGPTVSATAGGVSISYKGISEDGTVTLSFDVTIRSDKPNQTKVQMSMTFEVRQSFLSSLFKRSDIDMAKHVIEEHIVHYLLYYFKPVVSGSTAAEGVKVEPTEVFKEEGPLTLELPRALKAAGQVSHGVIVVRGEKVTGKIYVRNGKPVEFDVKMGGKELPEASALAELLTSDDFGEVVVYSIDLEQVAFQALRSIPVKKTVQA